MFPIVRIAGMVAVAVAAMMVLSSPAAAQYSPGYKFLEAVKKKDGEAVMEALQAPGSTIINSRDLTSGQSALHIVVERRDATWIGFLIQKGANPNQRDVKGMTPLVMATQMGFLEGVEALIKGGAHVDVADSGGETPLISAMHRHDIPLIRVLLKAGANPDRADNSGRSARDYALEDGANGPLMTEIERNAKSGGNTGKSYGPSL